MIQYEGEHKVMFVEEPADADLDAVLSYAFRPIDDFEGGRSYRTNEIALSGNGFPYKALNDISSASNDPAADTTNWSRIYSDVSWKDSWNTWGLIPSSRPYVPPPEAITNYLEIPGTSRVIDLTETLTGSINYKQRKPSFKFICDPDSYKSWSKRYSDLMQFFHGKRILCVLHDDPSYFYRGRFTFKSWSTGSQYSTITVEGLCDPYKQMTYMTDGRWLWDPFSFINGIARDYSDISVDKSATLTVKESHILFNPVLKVSNLADGSTLSVTIKHNGNTIIDNLQLHSGPNSYGGNLVPGVYEFIFTGTATVAISYRGGKL